MQEVLDNLESWGYLLLFVYSFYGGYVGLIAAATMSSLGKMDIMLCIIVAFVANTIGSSLTAYLSRHYKKDILPFFSKYKRQIALTQVWIKRYGKIAIYVSKYIHIVRFIVPVTIGISRYNFKNFLIQNAFACLLWAIVVGFVAFSAGNIVREILEYLNVNPYIVPVVVICWIIFVAFLAKILSKRIKKNL